MHTNRHSPQSEGGAFVGLDWDLGRNPAKQALRACLAEFLLRRQPPMRVIVVKRGSHDFGWLVVVDRCIRTATLRSWKAGAFVRLDLGFRACLAGFLLRRQPSMRATSVVGGSNDFG